LRWIKIGDETRESDEYRSEFDASATIGPDGTIYIGSVEGALYAIR
jgi:hypothetical protein